MDFYSMSYFKLDKIFVFFFSIFCAFGQAANVYGEDSSNHSFTAIYATTKPAKFSSENSNFKFNPNPRFKVSDGSNYIEMKPTKSVGAYLSNEGKKIYLDYENMFFTKNILYFLPVFGVAALAANTDTDEGLREFYADKIYRKSFDGLESVSYKFGDWRVVVPALFGTAISGKVFEDTKIGSLAYLWAERSLRGFLIGAPMVGVLQEVLGSSRPSDKFENNSSWNPFNDNNGVSGHALVGAIPLLTAATMVDNVALKGALVAGSFFSAWGRIQSDSHYFSQILLGWTIAFLSVESVKETELKNSKLQFTPILVPNGVGVGTTVKF